uniref:Major sperm protein n=1 Tax=Pristionchus pacificus TaxID=54126 RepID=A0A2A6CXR6_PRIPA
IMDTSSTSLADISLLLLADAAVPHYASAIVAALINVNQTLKTQVETIQADVRSIRESIEELKEMKREERRESEHHSHQRDQEAGEQNRSDAPNKRDLAFSVYLREMKSEPGETGGQRGDEEEEEDDDEEMNEEDEEDDDQPGPSAATAAAAAGHSLQQPDFSSMAALLMSSLPSLANQFTMNQMPTLSSSSSLQQQQPCSSSSSAADAAAAAREETATPGSSKRIILPCPRSGCEVLLYSQLGFSAHLRIHDGKMPFECTNCGREFRLRDGLVKHMRTHTGERPYPCQVTFKPVNEEQIKEIIIANTHNQAVIFKMKTTRPGVFKMKPVFFSLQPNTKVGKRKIKDQPIHRLQKSIKLHYSGCPDGVKPNLKDRFSVIMAIVPKDAPADMDVEKVWEDQKMQVELADSVRRKVLRIHYEGYEVPVDAPEKSEKKSKKGKKKGGSRDNSVEDAAAGHHKKFSAAAHTNAHGAGTPAVQPIVYIVYQGLPPREEVETK